MYKELKKPGKNLFFSPYSVSTALSVPYVGAKGETQEQMSGVLCNNLPQQDYHPAYGGTIDQLNQKNQKYQLDVANKVFVQDSYKVLDSFENTVKPNYGAAFWRLDFGNPAQASDEINSWVSEKTHDKIKDIVKPDMFNHLTRMVIANAIYFKGKWANPFEKSSTRPEFFYIDDTHWNRRVTVDMMHQTGEFNYMENDMLQMIELPYEGDRLSMLVILPKLVRNNNIGNIEKDISGKMLDDYCAQLKKEEVDVALPKFKLETSYRLVPVLKNMGMTSAFNNKANFSGISGKNDLYISDVLHKASVEVDEEGTEAAAATVVIMHEKCMRRAKRFIANNPFIFMIKDKVNGLILFMGKINNPNA